MKEIDLQYPTCPIRNILSRFSDKWSLLILSSIYRNKNIRYGEIKKEIPDISEKMLSKSLKNLEDYKLIKRKVYAEIPSRVEYSMTETGDKLIPSLQMMIDWASEHFKEISG